VIALGQLLRCGASRAQVKRWMRAGRLRQLNRGVYLVGAVAPYLAIEHAAVLACGEHAYASHQTAATLYRLPLPDRPTAVHVTVLNRDVRRPGITVHRTRALSREETQLLDGIPTTSPARTIVDLAPELEPADLEHLLAQAYAKKRVTRAKVLAVVALRPTRSGVRTR
jgi:predicted transcriptional regulator of viral defense system